MENRGKLVSLCHSSGILTFHHMPRFPSSFCLPSMDGDKHVRVEMVEGVIEKRVFQGPVIMYDELV